MSFSNFDEKLLRNENSVVEGAVYTAKLPLENTIENLRRKHCAVLAR